MNKEQIRVRWNVGSYDICHPSEKQCNVHILHPKYESLNLSLPEEHYDDFRENDYWSDIVMEALRAYIEKTWISSSLKQAKTMLEDLEKDETLAMEFDEAYACQRVEILKARKESAEKEIEKLKPLL